MLAKAHSLLSQQTTAAQQQAEENKRLLSSRDTLMAELEQLKAEYNNQARELEITKDSMELMLQKAKEEVNTGEPVN